MQGGFPAMTSMRPVMFGRPALEQSDVIQNSVSQESFPSNLAPNIAPECRKIDSTSFVQRAR